ncbi:DUF3047 domain-containing protein [Photobacterium sp. ZSDE20]|uniref:DUF3047 domain-containing protein n=1 Tax=Photobacterium pectinilyticum TaxID=2906793 RepID=A0ABT1N9H2_9GAMM|nr:DUF3047 domain-containing protein [Photobacterium sp. ZSDE20]MCQ1061202.1 DUF3047 domain-containing protein [Photobacterium sp. ZSDE20]MDD1829589.1 DUF3047 domain-containing protein [Photobacterium sp. ZSDE20]
MPILLRITPLLFSLSAFATVELPIAEFEHEALGTWKVKHFQGRTQYVQVRLEGQRVLKATSNNSATLLSKPIRIDLVETPYLNWSWRVENQLKGLNETTKDGDDYAARIYLAIGTKLLSSSSKAINYVWSSNQPRFSRWSNAFAGEKVQMIAIRGEADSVSQWQSEKRNVYQDFINMFGDKGSEQANREAYRDLNGIAIMTDTDNSDQAVTAYYGDIFFSAK